MKRFLKCLLALTLALSFLMSCSAGTVWDAEEAENEYLWFDGTFYFVTSEYSQNGQYMIFMYSRPSSAGTPIASYNNGEVVRALDYDADAAYCYAQGPDGKTGYLRKAWLMSVYDYLSNELYVVDSDYAVNGRYLVYMYAEPGSMGTPIGTYYDGAILSLIDGTSYGAYSKVYDSTYNRIGYVLSRRIRPLNP